MDNLNFRDIGASDKNSLQHLASTCRVFGGNVCPRCGCDEICRIEGGNRRRCPECGYRFTLYSGRWLNEIHVSPSSWLWIIKFFEMELTATRISNETKISYPTILKAVTAIRRSIAAATAHGREFLRNPGASRHIPVFYSREGGGGETTAILTANRIKILDQLEQGYLICTDKDVRHDSLLCDGIWHGPADFGRGFPRFRTYLAHPTGARHFIMERLHKYHGVRDEMLPLYVLEMEYRYNNHGSQLFELLVENICRFVPGKYRGAMERKPASVK